jgi:hypothetical protein
MADHFLKDLFFGLRLIRKNPGFSLIVVATLALGIGANTAIFSVVDAVLLRPLPYKESDSLVVAWDMGQNRGRNWFSAGLTPITSKSFICPSSKILRPEDRWFCALLPVP